MKVLLINSDIAKNRGDRAIAEGLIALILEKFPDAQITGISEQRERDEDWYGIKFLKSDVYTLNPFRWLELLWVASRSDLVLWGGGEYLKDYTNTASLWYWDLKTTLLARVNKNIYGVFQGIGPTASQKSRSLIARIVNRTRFFIVRDKESLEKLLDWGVDPLILFSAGDPAVYPCSKQSTLEFDSLVRKIALSHDDLVDFVIIGPRNWFHYRKGGIFPHRFRSVFSRSKDLPAENDQYIQALTTMIDLVASTVRRVVLLPMHMSEDTEFCDQLKSLASSSNITVLGEDNLTPQEVRLLLARARMMIGFRLHSNIVATSQLTPSLNYYYVDKGRAYFDQIDQSEFCFPIEDLIRPDFILQFESAFSSLNCQLESVELRLKAAMQLIHGSLKSAMDQIPND